MLKSLMVDGVHYHNDGVRRERADWAEIGLKALSGPDTGKVVRNVTLPSRWLRYARPGDEIHTGGRTFRAICPAD